ncbi:MAG TPA: ABC transporter substrate-binding protein [Xanthobacteraceae bacterium]|nr:ABC transporter substrate-binding protein [Xanthobacteraceae bacterium]
MRVVAKRLGPAALAFLSVCVLAGSASAAELKPWRHGVLEAKADAGFIMMVDRGGFAEKHGLKIETTQMKNGSTVIKALIAGELDSVDMGAAESIVAGARGSGVKIVGCTWPGLPQVVMSKAEIKSPQDLKGKTIAASSPGSLPDLLARALLDNYKIPVEDVKLANLGADLDRYKAMVAGVADAAVVSNEFGAIAPPAFKVLVSGRAIVPQFIRLCVASTEKVLTTRRDDLVKFVAAEMDAMAYAASHRDATVKLAHEMTNTKPDDPRAGFIFDQAVKDKQVDPTLAIPVANIDWMQSLFVKTGVLPKPGDTSKFVDESVRADALKLVGK